VWTYELELIVTVLMDGDTAVGGRESGGEGRGRWREADSERGRGTSVWDIEPDELVKHVEQTNVDS
jgi:hypothetical protein